MKALDTAGGMAAYAAPAMVAMLISQRAQAAS